MPVIRSVDRELAGFGGHADSLGGQAELPIARIEREHVSAVAGGDDESGLRAVDSVAGCELAGARLQERIRIRRLAVGRCGKH